MIKITYPILLVTIVLFTCSCKQIAYSQSDPTPDSPSYTISPKKTADYKYPVVFTTEVDYYEPVFDY